MQSTPPPAANHTLEILSYLAAQRGPVQAAVIASALGLPRSSTYRILSALVEHGYALHYPERQRYGLGYAAAALGSGFSRQEPLTRLGAPVLATLVARVGETAHLTVLHGTDVIYLVEERAKHRPPLVTGVGVRLPSYSTASGRALLASLPSTQLHALFSGSDAFDGALPGYSFSRLSRELKQVTRDGYAAEDGEVTPGFASVSVAIRDHAGWPAAGITLTYRRDDVDEAARATMIEALTRHAAELSRRIRGSMQQHA
ncbi:IclR family transcriptional regulator [Gryllotalpicola reticulitermitis]|uniref:IclR family transcriptional regulator n=1 Tax=Gryllotalpicola reticulitermitis TaxID=1184153 RepID=A0ABV8Q718_9MICO